MSRGLIKDEERLFFGVSSIEDLDCTFQLSNQLPIVPRWIAIRFFLTPQPNEFWWVHPGKNKEIP